MRISFIIISFLLSLCVCCKEQDSEKKSEVLESNLQADTHTKKSGTSAKSTDETSTQTPIATSTLNEPVTEFLILSDPKNEKEWETMAKYAATVWSETAGLGLAFGVGVSAAQGDIAKANQALATYAYEPEFASPSTTEEAPLGPDLSVRIFTRSLKSLGVERDGNVRIYVQSSLADFTRLPDAGILSVLRFDESYAFRAYRPLAKNAGFQILLGEATPHATMFNGTVLKKTGDFLIFRLSKK